MKTNRKEEENNVHDVHDVHDVLNEIENSKNNFDEKVLFSEETDFPKSSRLGMVSSLWLILGFPFYSIIGFATVIGYLNERTYSEIAADVIFPLQALLFLTVGLILLTTINLKKFLPTKEKTIITSKRIYASYLMPNGLVRDLEMKSSEYSNIQALYPYTDSSGQFIRVIMKPRQLQLEDLQPTAQSETEGYDRKYRVKNATVAYSFIPDHVKFSIGEKSQSVIKHMGRRRFEAVFGWLFMSLFAGAIALFSICFYAQEHSNDLLRNGRKAYARKQFDVAEATLKRAYITVQYFPFMHQYGMASYRYALALEANGRLDVAIPKFEQAVHNCNWFDDDDSYVDWRPAVFRSYVHLAEIYNKRDNKSFAGKYYADAFDTVSMETDITRARKFFNDYATYLRQRNEMAKAERVVAKAQSFAIGHSHMETFREDVP
ncbi:hypothetical protein BH10CYA1_BH10CYA1_40630 [soil metagenome]